MKNTDVIAEKSQNCKSNNPMTWLPIFYDCKTDTVLTDLDYMFLGDRSGVYKVTELINPSTKEEVEIAVIRWKMM